MVFVRLFFDLSAIFFVNGLWNGLCTSKIKRKTARLGGLDDW